MGKAMKRALNEFLGRTTVDPTLRGAYHAGRIEGVLRECGFEQGAAAQLARLRAPSFEDYLKGVYETVLAELEARRPYRHPWPTSGLPQAEPVARRRVEAA